MINNIALIHKPLYADRDSPEFMAVVTFLSNMVASGHHYISSRKMAKRIGVSAHVTGKIMGTLAANPYPGLRVTRWSYCQRTTWEVNAEAD